MKWSQLRKIAEQKGYRLKRNGANHDVYMNDKGMVLIIERHDSEEIKNGLYRKLKKQLGF